MRQFSELGMTRWDTEQVVAWVMAVPTAEIPAMHAWMSAPRVGGTPRSAVATGVARSLLDDRQRGASVSALLSKAARWAALFDGELDA